MIGWDAPRNEDIRAKIGVYHLNEEMRTIGINGGCIWKEY